MEMVLLLGLALLLFGAKRLPEIGRSVGHGMCEFKDSISGNHHDQAEIRHDLERIAADPELGEGAHVIVREHDTV
jgi:sec-independent protein translocase protein TatA